MKAMLIPADSMCLDSTADLPSVQTSIACAIAKLFRITPMKLGKERTYYA